MLSAVYNPQRPAKFEAYFSGRDGDDLRFSMDPNQSPEEVVFADAEHDSDRQGSWYSTHLQSEWKAKTASSDENKSIIDVQHYTIDSTISNNANLAATAAVKFIALTDG